MWRMILKQVLTAGVPWALRKVFGRRGFDHIGIVAGILDEILNQRPDVASELLAMELVRSEINELVFAQNWSNSKRRKLITEARRQVSAHCELHKPV